MRALLIEMAPATFRVLQGQARDVDTDVALVEALRRGDSQAELAAWNRFSVGVDQTLRRLLGPGPDREDLLQEVFIRFFRRINTCASRPRCAGSSPASASTSCARRSRGGSGGAGFR
jgi:hypothetical protein